MVFKPAVLKLLGWPRLQETVVVRTLRIWLEYEGTDFAGWQRQRGEATVQEELERALRAVLGRPTTVVAAGRTDRGVHALGQVAAFRTDHAIAADRLPYALNHHLPPSIRVVRGADAPPGFHPCRDATAKHYRYTIWCGRIFPALWRNFTAAVPYDLDRAAMREAAGFMVGRRDFTAFRTTAKGQGHLDTVKEVLAVILEDRDPFLVIDVLGTGFLYTQVRTMVGTLVEVGRGRFPPGRIPAILAAGDRRQAGPTAPARGLCLMQVFYGTVPETWCSVPGPVVGNGGPAPGPGQIPGGPVSAP